MDKIELRCPHCGSANIFKDAVAAWDAEAQEWTLVSVHDHETCEDCDRSGDYMAERRTLGAPIERGCRSAGACRRRLS